MPLQLSEGDVRSAHRDLRRAISTLKNAIKKANKSQSHDDWATVEFRRDKLEEEMADVTLIIRRASVKGFPLQNLPAAMVDAEAAIGDQGHCQVVVLLPVMTFCLLYCPLTPDLILVFLSFSTLWVHALFFRSLTHRSTVFPFTSKSKGREKKKD